MGRSKGNRDVIGAGFKYVAGLEASQVCEVCMGQAFLLGMIIYAVGLPASITRTPDMAVYILVVSLTSLITVNEKSVLLALQLLLDSHNPLPQGLVLQVPGFLRTYNISHEGSRHLQIAAVGTRCHHAAWCVHVTSHAAGCADVARTRPTTWWRHVHAPLRHTQPQHARLQSQASTPMLAMADESCSSSSLDSTQECSHLLEGLWVVL